MRSLAPPAGVWKRSRTLADTVVINTCAFIDPAKEESTHVILEHAAQKRRGQQLIVAGCLAQRYGAQLQSLIPEIDGVVGTGAYAGIVELLDDVEAGRRPVRLDLVAEPEHDFLPRLVTTPRATAYLKIAEGCDHPCTFCIIPALRGRFRSRSAESICAEARALVAGGAKELILIAQDTSMWGRDRGIRRGGLARCSSGCTKSKAWNGFGCSTFIPRRSIASLSTRSRALPKVCKYMDMPLQHVHPEVLRAMRRPSNGERYLELIDEFRSRVAGNYDALDLHRRISRRDATSTSSIWRIGSPARSSTASVSSNTVPRKERRPPNWPGASSVRRRRERLIRLREAQRLASERARSKRCGTIVRVLVEESRRCASATRSSGIWALPSMVRTLRG